MPCRSHPSKPAHLSPILLSLCMIPMLSGCSVSSDSPAFLHHRKNRTSSVASSGSSGETSSQSDSHAFNTPTELGRFPQTDSLSSAPSEENFLYPIPESAFSPDPADSPSPFEQKYWVVFQEGNRDDRLEASSIDSPLPSGSLYLVWDDRLDLSDYEGASSVSQYFLDENRKWADIGSWSRFSDYASGIIASNLDVYDAKGNLIVPKCTYDDIIWNRVYHLED